MRVLGIDPGYDIVGWSVVEGAFRALNYGIIKTDPEKNFEDRLLYIHRGLSSIIEEYKPEVASIEKLFFQKNTTTAMKVANAMGVILLTFKLYDIPFHEYTPTQVKQALTGFGKAEKKQMEFMVSKIFKLDQLEGPDDGADALAIAACHCIRR